METNVKNAPPSEHLNKRLAKSGLRYTSQRQHVYNILLATPDHPTAEQVFIRSKHAMPEISMATVYNCLDALVKCDLVNEVNLQRGATRYCPNMQEHWHFYCEKCGGVYDIHSDPKRGLSQFEPPPGFVATHYDLSIRGFCPACSQGSESNR